MFNGPTSDFDNARLTVKRQFFFLHCFYGAVDLVHDSQWDAHRSGNLAVDRHLCFGAYRPERRGALRYKYVHKIGLGALSAVCFELVRRLAKVRSADDKFNWQGLPPRKFTQ